jgi:hypothetical protein
LASRWLRQSIADAGISLIRMPGGSWSNQYGWAACERELADGCIAPFAARPSDFADLVTATGAAAMWTVSINETAQSAAATVAFFNGSVDDVRPIGVDRDGVDWGVVADWALLRTSGGHPEPVGIDLWEVGNEVYGASRSAGGDGCADFGWEEVWTCDGTTYVNGDEDHDGYLAIREAMLAVDPSISIGPVGFADSEAWGGWGADVADAVGDRMEFYVLHAYGFDESPSAGDVGDRPTELWPEIVDLAREVVPASIPLAVTEYNLVSLQAGDTQQSMTWAANALYIADSLGQMALEGIPIANQWNLVNGTTDSGTDYGMVDADGTRRFPQFTGMAVWAGTGSELARVRYPSGIDDTRVYATVHEDGALSLVIVHPADANRSFSIGFVGDVADRASVRSWSAASPTASNLTDSGLMETDLEQAVLAVTVPGWSLTRIDIHA